jgi:endonuclease-8
MPEGDTIFRAARTLHRALAGQIVTRFDAALPALTRVDHDRPIAGLTIEAVTSRGKHLLMTLSGDLVLHTHMRMNGSWHIYRPGERWQRPSRDMRVLIATATFVAVGFNVPVAEFLSTRDLARHRVLAALGPDLLDPSFDRDEARRRLLEHPRGAIAEVLLDQRVLSGIGNVLKSEILFVSGVDPFTVVADMAPAAIDRVLDAARDLLAANVLTRAQTLSPALGRRTTRSLDPDAKLWVYGRGGRACRRCGARIESRQTGVDARLTYWCPRCQSPVAQSPVVSRT